MEKLFNFTSIIGAGIGGVLAYVFGGFDVLITSLLVLVVLDYATGFIKGIYTKTLSSDIGFKGLLKKFLIFIVVAAAVIIQRLINDAIPLRETVIMFFICNEGISLLENAAEIIPIPQKLKDILLQLRDNNNDKEQKGGSSGMSFSDWVKNYLGKKTDYDGAYGVQCVDLIDCYIDKCLGLKKGFWGNAKEWWSRRNSNEWLKKNFDFITPIYKNGELKKGDIGIRTSGTYGHIFVVAGKTADGKIKYYDQNADGKGAAMTLREKPYTSSYINGVLRPKDRSNIELIKTVKANGGLNAYTSLTASKSSLLIPDGAKVEVINSSASKKKIKGVTYTMAKVIYKSKTYYVAAKYLK